TYMGAIETAEACGKRLYWEAWNRGWSRAQKKGALGDGAEWIWNLAGQHCPGGVQIAHLYHARHTCWTWVRRKPGSTKSSWLQAKSNWWRQFALCPAGIQKSLTSFAARRTTLPAMLSEGVNRSSAASICSSALASLRLAVKP